MRTRLQRIRRRRRSNRRELEFGRSWRERPDEPSRRAAWSPDTGELYLVDDATADRSADTVEVLAVVDRPERLAAALQGWAEVCGYRGSLAWLRERARRIDARREP